MAGYLKKHNALPDRVLDSVSLSTFKLNLAEYLGDVLFEYC